MTEWAPPSSASDQITTYPDTLKLHLWQLLDWRFLLPNPQPAPVGYGGDITKDVEQALFLLDPQAGRITADGSSSARQYELVFLACPDRPMALAAQAAVQPGGWICIQHRRSFAKVGSPRTLLGWKRLLKKRGFEQVSVYWFAPGLEAASRIIPVDSKAAVMDTLGRNRGVRWGAVKAAMGRVAFAFGLFAAAVPEGTVTGQRPQSKLPGGEGAVY